MSISYVAHDEIIKINQVNQDAHLGASRLSDLHKTVMSYFLMRLGERLGLLRVSDEMETTQSDGSSTPEPQVTVWFDITGAVRDTIKRYPIFTFFDPRDVYIAICTWQGRTSDKIRSELTSPTALERLSLCMKTREYSQPKLIFPDLFQRASRELKGKLNPDVVRTYIEEECCIRFLCGMLGDRGLTALLRYWEEVPLLFSKYPHECVIPEGETSRDFFMAWENRLTWVVSKHVKKRQYTYDHNVVYLAQALAFASCALWRFSHDYRRVANVHTQMTEREFSHLFHTPLAYSIFTLLNELPDGQASGTRCSIADHGVLLGESMVRLF